MTRQILLGKGRKRESINVADFQGFEIWSNFASKFRESKSQASIRLCLKHTELGTFQQVAREAKKCWIEDFERVEWQRNSKEPQETDDREMAINWLAGRYSRRMEREGEGTHSPRVQFHPAPKEATRQRGTSFITLKVFTSTPHEGVCYRATMVAFPWRPIQIKMVLRAPTAAPLKQTRFPLKIVLPLNHLETNVHLTSIDS